MNFEFFIAKRIIGSKSYKSSISAPIIKIGIAAIAIGLIVMLIAIATGIGLQQKIRDKTVAFNGHITITNYDSNQSEESQYPINIDQEFYPEFTVVEGVRHVQAVASKFGVIRTTEDFDGAVLKGVGKDYDWQFFEEFLIDGKLPRFGDSMSNDVLVSKYLANRLNFEVGSSFEMLFAKDDPNRPPFIRKFNVVGVFNSGFQELDETYLIGDIRHVQRLNRWEEDQVGHFEVFIEDYNDIQIKGLEIHDSIHTTLKAETVRDKYYTIFEWLDIFDQNIYMIISIMILVAGINMITALLVLILERTQMIGILKSLGGSNWMIRKVFVYNASYLILLGLFWGNVIGIGILLAQKYFKFVPLDPSVYHVTEVAVYLNWTHVLLLNIGTFVLCFLMLMIPSYVITKITPVKAMRFQ